MHLDGASVDLDNDVLLIVSYQAAMSCCLIPWWSQYQHSFDDDDAGKVEQNKLFGDSLE